MRKRGHVIPLRLTDQELAHLNRCAAASGLPREEYLRSLIMGKTITPRWPAAPTAPAWPVRRAWKRWHALRGWCGKKCEKIGKHEGGLLQNSAKSTAGY